MRDEPKECRGYFLPRSSVSLSHVVGQTSSTEDENMNGIGSLSPQQFTFGFGVNRVRANRLNGGLNP